MSGSDGQIPTAAQQRLDVPEPPVRPRKGLPRAADLAIAVIALALVSPLLLAAAIAIKLESRGPVFYRQRRVGRDGLIFELFKLRTMRQGADPGAGAGAACRARPVQAGSPAGRRSACRRAGR